MSPAEISAFRKLKGLSQTELGKLCGVGNSAISQWESGATQPTGPAKKLLQEYMSGQRKTPESTIDYSSIDQRLAAIGKDRKWLAEQTKYSEAAVREALAPKSQKRSRRLFDSMDSVISAEEQRSSSTNPTYPNKTEIKLWLRVHNRSRAWLAERCGGIDKRTVDNWLSSSKAIPLSQLALIKMLMAKDQPSQSPKSPDLFLTSIVLKPSQDEFDAWNRAAMRQGLLVREWLEKLIREASEDSHQ